MKNKNSGISADTEMMQHQMVEIPAGTIALRDDRINRKWAVEIQPFLLAKYPATQSLYFSVSGQSPSTFKGEQNPVESVSWNNAIAFCNLLSQKSGLSQCYTVSGDGEETAFDETCDGYRLPSEAEWEYACRAGTDKPRYGDLDAIAWYKDNSASKAHKVGQKAPNAWGLHDMLGNVWEWCWDKYDEEVYGPYRVFRGGGWADPQRGCLATNRRRSHPTFQIDDLGFRIARSLKS